MIIAPKSVDLTDLAKKFPDDFHCQELVPGNPEQWLPSAPAPTRLLLFSSDKLKLQSAWQSAQRHFEGWAQSASDQRDPSNHLLSKSSFKRHWKGERCVKRKRAEPTPDDNDDENGDGEEAVSKKRAKTLDDYIQEAKEANILSADWSKSKRSAHMVKHAKVWDGGLGPRAEVIAHALIERSSVTRAGTAVFAHTTSWPKQSANWTVLPKRVGPDVIVVLPDKEKGKLTVRSLLPVELGFCKGWPLILNTATLSARNDMSVYSRLPYMPVVLCFVLGAMTA